MKSGLLIGALFSFTFVLQSRSARANDTCVKGKSTAPVKIEIFNDYQCPACRAFYLQTMRTVFAEYADKGKVCVMYRHFPLETHPYSRQAARYVQAALSLGLRQWAQVVDALFTSQDDWGADGNIDAFLKTVLSTPDMAALRSKVQDDALEKVIDADIMLGLDREVNSTPTFFIIAHGERTKYAAALTYTALRRHLDEALQK
jgi:protein-disulfide isomerase